MSHHQKQTVVYVTRHKHKIRQSGTPKGNFSQTEITIIEKFIFVSWSFLCFCVSVF